MNQQRLEWYWRRLGRMSVPEMVGRVGDHARRRTWRRRQVTTGATDLAEAPGGPRTFTALLPTGTAEDVPPTARRALIEAADRVLQGRWEIFGVDREDIVSPDWFMDPVTGRRAPQERYAFGINHRSEEESGNVKQIWELSRHHHLTVLSAAWFLTGDERYAEIVARQLRSWWRENPFLSGVHWTSGIEVGLRLIAWAWIRRLLDGWAGTSYLFEGDDDAVRQLYWHQNYLSTFRSQGSSANNHVIAEAAGQLVASCAFPWFPHSDRWRTRAAALLERELERNTFPSGVNRELASDYHAFVAELGLLAAVEADVAGHPLGEATRARLCRMVDVVAAIVDERLNGPRQGDGDEGRGLLVDAPEGNRWSSLLATGAQLYGSLSWWPTIPSGDVRSTLLAALSGGSRYVDDRPRRRPSHFADAGLTLLRTAPAAGPEIWCRCDGGPHGYLSIAAHAHADALSIEVRHGGVAILADPGTYSYHGEREWREYFRSTIGHNTLELGRQDQSQAGGPFLWVDHAPTRVLDVVVDTEDGVELWSAQHDGYRRLKPPAVHQRTVRLDGAGRSLEVVDRVDTQGRHPCRLAFHLGPSVLVTLEGCATQLEWPGDGAAATLHLPPALSWSTPRGQTDPILCWYSPAFGQKEPTITLVGSGTVGPEGSELVTVLRFGT